MCVGVTLWYGFGGMVSICTLKHYSVVLQPAYVYFGATAELYAQKTLQLR